LCRKSLAVTTRSALLRALAGLLLASTLVMAALSFFAFRHAMQVEIAANLQFSASVIKERIDTLLYTQVENIRSWRSLQVMQDITVGDIDKRASGALSELRAGKKALYKALICTDNSGRIVAASNPAMIGSTLPVDDRWQTIAGPSMAAVFVAPMERDNRRAIALRTVIPNAFGKGGIGQLFVLLDFSAFENVLDQAVGDGPRSLLILDSQGNVIGASSALRERLDIPNLRLENWTMPKTGVTSYVHDGTALGDGTLLVGAAASSQYQQLAEVGWRILMIEPTTVAFRPVLHLLWGLLALLVVTMTVGVWIASRLAGTIALPIVELTAFTRRFRQGDESLPERSSTATSEVAELFGTYVDMIRALQKSREEVVRAGKLAVVGEMAAIMAHEIRTPMSIVRSSAQLLERQPDLSDKERELIGFMLGETERLNRLVTMLLECARPKPPEFQPQDLHAIIRNVFDLLATRVEAARVHVRLDLESQPVIFDCDKEQMMQVLLNLILNALQFIPEGGRLGIRTSLDAGALRISVSDDGPGVPAPIRERIFDPFFSRREGGIGLGLTIVQQIVQAHGGEIVVGESAWGGAAFNMCFPLDSGVRHT
jgi:signal transduction histidine kinase